MFIFNNVAVEPDGLTNPDVTSQWIVFTS
jgi:hypothetical protein